MTATSRLAITAVAVLSTNALHAAEFPDSVNDALRVVGSARRTVAEMQILTGTEAFDPDAFRQALMEARGATPYEAYTTAEAVVQVANGAGTTSAQLASFSIGWAALDVNWVFATLLGDTEAAAKLLTESNSLINYQALYMANVEQGGAFASFYPRIEANSLALTLRRTASEMNLISLIPNAMDPEGFVRQRLQIAYNRLTNAAEFVHNAGEAFTFYY